MKLSIDFPDKKKINTLEHYKYYVAGSNKDLVNRYKARKAFALEAINLDLGMDDDIMLYLFSGIGTYTEKVTFHVKRPTCPSLTSTSRRYKTWLPTASWPTS